MLKTSSPKRTITTAGRAVMQDADADAALWQMADAQDRLALADCAVAQAEAAKSAALLEVARAEEALDEWRAKRVERQCFVSDAPAELRKAA